MSFIFADTSAWSRLFRDDVADTDPVVEAMSGQLRGSGVATTGVVYLELLRGFTRDYMRAAIEQHFLDVPFIEPDRDDYAAAADLSLACRRGGVQLETIDALITQICIANDLTLLTADADFVHAARHIPLDVWCPT